MKDLTDITVDQFTEHDRKFVVQGISDLQEVERQITDTRRPGSEVAATYVDRIIKTIEKKSGAVFVAYDAGRQVGFTICWIEREENVAETPDSTTYGYISDAYVISEYRGQGVFKMLTQKAEEYLSQFLEVKRIRINVLAQNAQALAAYRSAGYSDYEIMLEKKVN